MKMIASHATNMMTINTNLRSLSL